MGRIHAQPRRPHYASAVTPILQPRPWSFVETVRVAVLACACGFAAAQPVPKAAEPAVLRVVFPVAESGFDPQVASDEYSANLCRAIFDPLYTYDYFARPVRLVPNTAAALPQIADGGRTYTIRVRPGIFFPPHPAFGGTPRELTAADYAYSIRRVADPKVRSYWLYLLEGRLAGLDGLLADARRTGAFDYDAPIEGLQVLDRFTLRLRFRDPDYGFQHWLTTNNFAAVAREVVEAKKDESNRVMEDPVGTGPYRLAEWRRSQRVVLEANPHFRDLRYPAPGADAADAAVARGLTGRRLPLTPRVEVTIVEEAQPRLLSFRRGDLDYVEVPTSISNTVLAGDTLLPELSSRGVRLHRTVDPALAFVFFNLDDPVVGGYSPERVALRRAITMARDRKTASAILAHGQATPANQLVPPPVPGHELAFAFTDPYDPASARALLDRFGYRDRDGDGWREQPDGSPLTLVKGSTNDAAARNSDELWKKNMDAVGLRIGFVKQTWPELNKLTENGKLMMWNLAWISSIPDADSFLSPLYSKNVGLSNDARFRLPAYDEAYDAARKLPPGAARLPYYRKMNELVTAWAPWIIDQYTFANILAQPWLRGYKQNPFLRHQWEYYAVGDRK
jgi:ABC-type transport system substrate-binding protein